MMSGYMVQIYFRQMEDFITWTDTSAIKKHVLDYNEMVRTSVKIALGEK